MFLFTAFCLYFISAKQYVLEIKILLLLLLLYYSSSYQSKYAIDRALTCVCRVLQPPAAGGAPVWAVSAAEQVQYRDLFVKTDTDMDGFVDGGQLREIIMKSGLPQNILAHIW